MAHEEDVIICEPDDPNRCQATTRHGQCKFGSLDGSNMCFRHCRNRKVIERKKMNNYLLSAYYGRANDLAGSESIKDLKDEIAILRMLMEKLLNNINSDSDLLIYTPQISDLVVKIQNTVLTSHKLESQMGSLMSKEEIVIICNNMVNIISESVNDPVLVQNIAEKIGDSLDSKVMS